MIVKAPWLKGRGVCLTKFVKKKIGSEEKTFVKILKTDPGVHRLITGRCRSRNNLLSGTRIIEDIIEKRNEARLELLRKANPNSQDAAEDLGIDDDEGEDLEQWAPYLPEMMCINTEKGNSVNVLCHHPRTALWMELTTEIVDELHDLFVETQPPAAPEDGDGGSGERSPSPEGSNLPASQVTSVGEDIPASQPSNPDIEVRSHASNR